MSYRIIQYCFTAITIAVTLAACQPSCPDADLAFNRGQNAFIQGRYELARVYFSEDLLQNPGRPESLKKLGIAWLQGVNGVLSNSLENFDQYLAAYPDDAAIKISRAKTLLRVSDWSRLQSLDIMLGSSLDEQLVKADILAAQNRPDALELMLKILTDAPDNANAHEIAASIYQQQGDWGKALEHAQQSMALGSTVVRPYYIATQAATRLQNSELAQRMAIEYEAINMLRRVDRHPNISTEQLRDALNDFHANTPVSQYPSELLTYKINLLFKIGDRQPAEALFYANPWRQVFSESQLLTLATGAVNVQAHEMAKHIYEHVRRTNPNNETVRLGLARVALQEGDYSLLEQHASAALEEQCWIASHHYYLAQVDIYSEADELAVVHLTDALRMAPWRVDWRLLLANLHLSLGQIVKANQTLDEAPTASLVIDQFRRQQGLH